jgi:hypothetical protein
MPGLDQDEEALRLVEQAAKARPRSFGLLLVRREFRELSQGTSGDVEEARNKMFTAMLAATHRAAKPERVLELDAPTLKQLQVIALLLTGKPVPAALQGVEERIRKTGLGLLLESGEDQRLLGPL